MPTSANPFLSLKNPVRAILFDIYGTLIISKAGDISFSKKETETSAMLTTLLDKYAVNQTVEELLDRFYRFIENTHKNLKKSGVDFPEVNIDRIWMDAAGFDDIHVAQNFAIEFEMIVNPVYPMPGLNEILKTVNDRNIFMGIISNAQFYTPLLFDMFFDAMPEQLGFHPDLIFYSYQYNHAKPSLYLFQKAVKQITKM